MMNEALIVKYFSRTISKDELLEFENLYKTDSEFKLEVDFLKNVKSVSEKEDDEQFKKQLAFYEEEYNENQKKEKIKWFKPLTVAAAVVFMVLSITFLWNNTKSNEELFADYFEPSKNVSAPIVRSEVDESIANNAFIAYAEGNYKDALPLFEKAFSTSNNSELLFYEGNSHLAIGDTEKAIEKFNKHITFSDTLTNRSHWYLALAYLKMEQNEKAKTELKVFIDSNESFKKVEAKSLLEKLE